MKKNLVLMFVLMSFFAVMAFSASASNITWVNPSVNGATISGTSFKLNVSNIPSAFNISNVSFYYTPAGGALTLIGTNTSINNTVYGLAFDTSILDDGVLYTLTARALNQSNAAIIETETLTSIIVDNTNPSCTITAPAANSQNEYTAIESVTLTATMTATSSCSFTVNNKLLTGTLSGGVCTGSINGLTGIPEGTFTLTATGTDQSSETGSCTQSSVGFFKSKNLLRYKVAAEEDVSTDSGTGDNGKTILLLLGAVSALWYFNKKK